MYDGTLDQTLDGVKPIAIQIEDFDKNGNMISSMPIQFLATVWTPTSSNFANRQLQLHGPGNPFVYNVPSFSLPATAEDHQEFIVDTGRRRRAGTQPSYCDAFPVWSNSLPQSGDIIDVSVTGTVINLKATTDNDSITRINYRSPIGMTCTPVNANEEASCTFVPSAGQMGQVHNFCLVADDSAGLQTPRVCISLNGESALVTTVASTTTTTTTTTFVLVDIFLMIDQIDARNPSYANYECACRGNMDAYKPTIGQPVDVVRNHSISENTVSSVHHKSLACSINLTSFTTTGTTAVSNFTNLKNAFLILKLFQPIQFLPPSKPFANVTSNLLKHPLE